MTMLSSLLDLDGNRKYLSDRERWAFLNAVECEPDQEKKLFCLILFYTGCRISEGLRLTAAHLQPDMKIIVFRSLKKRGLIIFRFILVPARLMKALKGYTGDMPPSERLFKFSRTTGWRIVKEKMKEVGICGIHACPRGLRHGYATGYASMGTSEKLVQKWLGHASLKTTYIYYDMPQKAELKQAKRLWYRPFNKTRIFIYKLKKFLSKRL